MKFSFARSGSLAQSSAIILLHSSDRILGSSDKSSLPRLYVYIDNAFAGYVGTGFVGCVCLGELLRTSTTSTSSSDEFGVICRRF